MTLPLFGFQPVAIWLDLDDPDNDSLRSMDALGLTSLAAAEASPSLATLQPAETATSATLQAAEAATSGTLQSVGLPTAANLNAAETPTSATLEAATTP